MILSSVRDEVQGDALDPPVDDGATAGFAVAAVSDARGLGAVVRSAAGGERITVKGLLAALGGWLAVFESFVPGLLYIVLYVFLNARVSAIVAGVFALAAVLYRIFRRQSLVTAVSGVVGVVAAVGLTLFSGRGVDYFVPGFITNGVWILVLLVSMIVRLPLLGFAFALVSGGFLGWRRVPGLFRVATFLTFCWLGLFVLRLAVQLPLFFAQSLVFLGAARIAMGLPLFAVLLIFTWVFVRRASASVV